MHNRHTAGLILTCPLRLNAHYLPELGAVRAAQAPLPSTEPRPVTPAHEHRGVRAAQSCGIAQPREGGGRRGSEGQDYELRPAILQLGPAVRTKACGQSPAEAR